MSRVLALAALATALAACATADVAIDRNFDFSRVRRVAVVGFPDFRGRGGSGAVVGAAFEQSLLAAGYSVVDRGQVDRALAEQGVALGKPIDARAARRLGTALGVDALLVGDITALAAPRSRTVSVSVEDDQAQPVYAHRARRVQNPDGSWTEVGEDYVAGYRTARRYRREPRSVVDPGKLAVSARLIAADGARLLWRGTDATETMAFEDSARTLSDDILKAVKSTWPRTPAR